MYLNVFAMVTFFFFSLLQMKNTKPLTFLAGQAVAKSVGMVAIDFVLLLASVPQLLQYVLCHLMPSQLMQLFRICHGKLTCTCINANFALPGYHHAELPQANTSCVLMNFNSNNVDPTVIGCNMYLSLLEWSTYLFEMYHIDFIPMQRWVHVEPSVLQKLHLAENPRLLLVMPHQMTDASKDYLVPTCSLSAAASAEPSCKKHKSHSAATIITMTINYHAHTRQFCPVELPVYLSKLKEVSGTLCKNLNVAMLMMDNDACHRNLFQNLSTFLVMDNVAPNRLSDLNKYDVCSYYSLVKLVLYEYVYHFYCGQQRMLEMSNRFVKMGMYSLTSSYNHRCFKENASYLDLIKEMSTYLPYMYLPYAAANNDAGVTRIDALIKRLYEFQYLVVDPLTIVPCPKMADMCFYSTTFAQQLDVYCRSNRMLTMSGVTNLNKVHQFQRALPLSAADGQDVAEEEVGFRHMVCCIPQEILASSQYADEVSLFGQDSVLCYMIAALNQNRLGRPHMGLVYIVESIHKLQQVLQQKTYHYHKCMASMAWTILCCCLDMCCAESSLIIKVWKCALGFATVHDVEPLIQLVQQLCQTRGCFQVEQKFMSQVYLPKMIVYNSGASFTTCVFHLDNLFYRLENAMVLLLCKSNYKELANVACCGTLLSLEEECYILSSRIKSVLKDYLKPLFKMSNVDVYRLFYMFYKIKLKIFTYSDVAHLDRLERITNPLNSYILNRLSSLKINQLHNSLDSRYTNKVKIESSILEYFLDFPFSFITYTDHIDMIVSKVRSKTKLQHSIELADMYFHMGFLHLISGHMRRASNIDPATRHNYFTHAHKHYATASSGQQYLHRLRLSEKLHLLDQAVDQKMTQAQEYQHAVDEAVAARQPIPPLPSPPNPISFLDVLKEDLDQVQFLTDCCTNVQDLMHPKNNNYMHVQNQSSSPSSMSELLHVANSTLANVKSCNVFLNACFDLKYNH